MQLLESQDKPDGSESVTGLFPEYTYALNYADVPASRCGSTLRDRPIIGS